MLMSMSETTGGSGTHPVRKCDSLVELLCSLRRRSDAHQEPLYRFLQITVSEFWAFSLRAHFATYDLRTSLLSEIVLSQRIGLHASSPATSHQPAIYISLGRKGAESRTTVKPNPVFVSPGI